MSRAVDLHVDRRAADLDLCVISFVHTFANSLSVAPIQRAHRAFDARLPVDHGVVEQFGIAGPQGNAS
jgi:hypothetical protein